MSSEMHIYDNEMQILKVNVFIKFIDLKKVKAGTVFIVNGQ